MGAEFYLSVAKAFLENATALLTFWPLWMVAAGLLVARLGPSLYDWWRLSRAGMTEVDQMTGLEFEKFLQYLFERQGYVVERTRYVGDYGGDLVLRKNGVRTLVQAKRYKGTVGNKAIQEAAAARPHYDCSNAMVVTNSHFSRQARTLAASNHIELWDRTKLADAILAYGMEYRRGRHQDSPRTAQDEAAASAGGTRAVEAPYGQVEDSTPACPRCGHPMVLRHSKRGKFWGCSHFPSCRGIIPIDR